MDEKIRKLLQDLVESSKTAETPGHEVRLRRLAARAKSLLCAESVVCVVAEVSVTPRNVLLLPRPKFGVL